MSVQLSENQIKIIIDCIMSDAERSYMTESMETIIDTLLVSLNKKEK